MPKLVSLGWIILGRTIKYRKLLQVMHDSYKPQKKKIWFILTIDLKNKQSLFAYLKYQLGSLPSEFQERLLKGWSGAPIHVPATSKSLT